MATISRITVDRLINQGMDLVVEIEELETKRFDTYVKLAKVIVQLRSKFQYNGKPDWAGKSQDYRNAASKIYEGAGVPPDSLMGIQSNVRYHIGNELRERLTADELTEAGLSVEGPRERQAGRTGSSSGASSPTSVDIDGGPGEVDVGDGQTTDLRSTALADITRATLFVRQAQLKLPSDPVEIERVKLAAVELSGETLVIMQELGAFESVGAN